jgi:hypothetical protein
MNIDDRIEKELLIDEVEILKFHNEFLESQNVANNKLIGVISIYATLLTIYLALTFDLDYLISRFDLMF